MIAQDDLPGCFYGFPVLPKDSFKGPEGFKLAWHYPGTLCDPDKVNRSVSKEDLDVLKTFLDKFFPGLYVSANTAKTCLYTNSPDEHFIIDYLPGYEGRVAVAAGFSGHGFKFVSVVGEVLCDMLLQGASQLPVEFLSLHRFGNNPMSSKDA
jgi:sarcosine oxidase